MPKIRLLNPVIVPSSILGTRLLSEPVNFLPFRQGIWNEMVWRANEVWLPISFWIPEASNLQKSYNNFVNLNLGDLATATRWMFVQTGSRLYLTANWGQNWYSRNWDTRQLYDFLTFTTTSVLAWFWYFKFYFARSRGQEDRILVIFYLTYRTALAC